MNKYTLISSVCILFALVAVCFCEKSAPDVICCQDKEILLGSSKNMAKIVDIIPGANVYLECHYCKEKDNYHPKMWYFRQRGHNATEEEVKLEMESESIKQNKLSMTPWHTLHILNFTVNDTGIYTCKHFDSEEETVFTFLLEAVYDILKMPKIGKVDQWQDYKRHKLDSVNEKIEKSKEEPFNSMRSTLDFSFRLHTVWESWGPCENCGKHRGLRRKLGKCRLHPVLNTYNKSQEISVEDDMEKIKNIYMIDNYDIPCRSLSLNESLPDFSNIVKQIEDFEVIEFCNSSICNAVTDNILSGRKTDYKYKVTKWIAENGHETLICPEVTLDSSVEWYKDKKLLNSSFRNNMAQSAEEPHLTIDAYNTLYILHASKDNEAIYGCVVNGDKIQKFDLRVVSKSKLLNQEFIRYSIYLAFVLSLTLTCYCAGMFVAWSRRSSFADPLNYDQKLQLDYSENEELLP